MQRRVDVEIGKSGQVKVEFSGFEGEICFEEADRLRRVLGTMGLWALPLTVAPKTSSEIELEVDVKEDRRRKVPVG